MPGVGEKGCGVISDAEHNQDGKLIALKGCWPAQSDFGSQMVT